MGCNCEPKKYSISMGCCEPVLGPIEAYYTKFQIDKMLEEIESGITSGCCITPEEVDEKIDEAISGISPDLSDYYTKEEVDELIPEVPSLSGYATEQWVLDKHYISGVDLSDYALKSEIPTVPTSNTAFTNDAGYLTEHQSLSGYATEQWVEDKHYITGVDLSDYVTYEDLPSLTEYATHEWVENKHYITGVDLSDYATLEDIPSLSGYATEQWVINQNYALNSELIQYITNLQNQIDSLKEQISGCCGDTGETITRWITMTGASDYTCSGTTKYTKEKEQTSTDGGNTWSDTGNYRSGSTVLEVNSVDCGYIAPQYRWKAAPTSDYMCSGTSKYYKVYYEVSYDNGQTWQHVVPEQTKRGNLIEANSTDCGYVPTPKFTATYRDGTSYSATCNNSSTLSSGETKAHTTDISAMTTVVIGNCVNQIGTMAFAQECVDDNIGLTSVTIPNTVTTIGGSAFFGNNSLSSITIPSSVRTIGSSAFNRCKSLGSIVIPNGVTKIDYLTFGVCHALSSVTIPNSVSIIGDKAFNGCQSLRSIVIPSGVTQIDSSCFYVCSNLTSVTCKATTPPAIGYKIFRSTPIENGNGFIYVPSASVNAYKVADGWSQYASRIQAIP